MLASRLRSNAYLPPPRRCVALHPINRLKTMRYLFSFVWLLTALAAQAHSISPTKSLDELNQDADLVCKAKVIATAGSGRHCEARLQLITIFKGGPGTNQIRFTYSGERADEAVQTPKHADLHPGQSYLLFARTNKAGGGYRQILEFHTFKDDNGAMRTLDDRPCRNVSFKEAHWLEVSLLLTNSTPADALYAIGQLNSMIWGCEHTHTNRLPYPGARRGPKSDFDWCRVAPTLVPQVRHTNDEIAMAAMKLFWRGACAAATNDYASDLAEQARTSRTIARRTTAMKVLVSKPPTAFANDLPGWLAEPAEEVRTAATFLLPSIPVGDATPLLRQQTQDPAANVREAAAQVVARIKLPELIPVLAKDPSPNVRAMAAGTIATGKFKELIPVLATLMNDPTGVTNKLGSHPNDAGSLINQSGPVRTAAAYALLGFPVDQVEAELKANLNDDYFKVAFLARLSATNPVAWMTELLDVVERKLQPCNWGQGGRSDPVFYSNPHGVCVTHLWTALNVQPNADILAGKFDRYFQAFENGGISVAGELERIYGFYLGKGMLERAAKFKETSLKKYGPSFEQGFQRVERNLLGRNIPAAP